MCKTKPLGMCLPLTLGLGLMLALLWSLSGGGPGVYAASITVNTTDDELNSDGDCSLREAIQAANTDAAVDACGPGSNSDTIEFDLGTPAVVTLTLGQLTIQNDPLTLEGLGAGLLTIRGNGSSRIIEVVGGVAVTLTGMTVRGGNTTGDGGGLRSGGAVTLIGTVFTGNAASDDGGAMDVQGNLTMSDTQVLSNTAAGRGGGANAFGSLTRIIGGRIENNRSGEVAGGVYVNQSLVLSGTQFLSNTTQILGGGACVWGSSTITNAHFERNSAQHNHAGALYANGDLSIRYSSFVSNTAAGRCGAVCAGNEVHIIGGRFSGNLAQTDRAGALNVGGTLWLTGTHFVGNRSATYGGALVHLGSDGRLVNALFARNHADSDGGAAYLTHSGNLEFIHATIVAPAGSTGAAILVNATGRVTVTNTIVASYTYGLDGAAGSVFEDHNLFYQVVPIHGTVVRGGHSLIGDPAFADPAADDYHLTASSPALNTAADLGIATDGDGEARPGGGGVDMGYDETTYVSDIAVAKTANTDPEPGAPITYTIHFSNVGNALLPGVVITDVIPGLVFQLGASSSGAVITDTAASPSYVWQASNLAPGEGGTITVTGVLTDPLPRGTFTNTVEVATAATESDTSNNLGTAGVTVSNRAPLAIGDTFTVPEDIAVALEPLNNDVDGDPLHISALGQPLHAVAALSGTTRIIYTPTLDFHGPDVFTYTASDGELADTATISIVVTPINDAPVIAEGATVSVTMSEDGHPTPFHLVLNAGDVEGDSLTWSIPTPPTHGHAAVASPSTISVTVVYTPVADYNGTDIFAVQASDSELTDTIDVSVTVEPVNDAPVAADDVAVILRRASEEVTVLATGPAVTLDPLANDTDLEDDPLTVANVGVPSQGGASSVSVGGERIVYTPATTFSGIEVLTYTVTDGGLTDTARMNVTVVNGSAGGRAGDTIVIPNTGADGTFTVTIDIPAGVEDGENLVLVYQELAEAGGPPPEGYGSTGLFFSLRAFLNGQMLDADHVFQQPLTVTVEYAHSQIAHIGSREQSLLLYSWDGNAWSRQNITVVDWDATGCRFVVAIDRPAEFGLFGRRFVYLPLVQRDHVTAPDLVVQSITATSTDVQVVIENQGNAPVVDEFWVAAYIDPNPAPTAVNQLWWELGDEGIFWGVTEDLLPLNPGDTITLSVGDTAYVPDYSRVSWPLAPGTPVYVQVDAWNADTDYGAVLEIHEVTGATYNNISGPYFSTTAVVSPE